MLKIVVSLRVIRSEFSILVGSAYCEILFRLEYTIVFRDLTLFACHIVTVMD